MKKAWLILDVNNGCEDGSVPEMCVVEIKDGSLIGLGGIVKLANQMKKNWPSFSSLNFEHLSQWIGYNSEIASLVESNGEVIAGSSIHPNTLRKLGEGYQLSGFRVQVWPDGDLSFMCDSERYGVLDSGLINIQKLEKLFAECEE
jgi:hypothetical protein